MTSEISRAVAEQINYLAQAQAIMTLISKCKFDSALREAAFHSANAASDMLSHVASLSMSCELAFGHEANKFLAMQIEHARALMILVAICEENAKFDGARAKISGTVSRILQDAVDHLKCEVE